MNGCKKDAIDGSRYCVMHNLSYRSYGNPDYNAVSSITSSNKSTKDTEREIEEALEKQYYIALANKKEKKWKSYTLVQSCHTLYDGKKGGDKL